MTEPPSAWTVPGDEPEPGPPSDPPPSAVQPSAVPPPALPPSGSAPTGWGSPPEYGPQPGWGPAPTEAEPRPWGGQTHPEGGQGNQWGGQGNHVPGPPAPGNWSNRGPGIVPLRPLAIGEIYDGAVRAIRSNPRTLVGISAIVISLLTLLGTVPQAYATAALMRSALLGPQAGQNASLSDVVDMLNSVGITLIVAVLQFVLATTILSGLLIVAVDGAVRGQQLSPADLWVRARSRLFGVLGLACLVVLTMPLIMLLGLLPGLIVVFLPSGTVVGVILLVLGALAGTAAFVALYFGFWAVAAPALLLENLGVLAALRRSYRLVRGSFWRVLGIGLLTAVIAYLVRSVFSIPFLVVATVIGPLQGDGFTAILIQLLITSIGEVLAGAVLFPFTAGVAALLYLDLRMRREGLDVDLMRS